MNCFRNLFQIFILTIYLYSVECADCPTPPLVKEFNLTLYSGVWYEIQSYPNENQLDISCVSANYEIQTNSTDNSTYVKITNSGFNTTSNKEYTRNGEAKQNPANPDQLGDFVVDFGEGKFLGQYKVLNTDYNNSLVYSCRKSGDQITEYAWILSREKTLNDTVIGDLVKILADAKSNTTLFVKTDQNKCSGATQTSLTLSIPLIVLIYFLFTKITA